MWTKWVRWRLEQRADELTEADCLNELKSGKAYFFGVSAAVISLHSSSFPPTGALARPLPSPNSPLSEHMASTWQVYGKHMASAWRARGEHMASYAHQHSFFGAGQF